MPPKTPEAALHPSNSCLGTPAKAQELFSILQQGQLVGHLEMYTWQLVLQGVCKRPSLRTSEAVLWNAPFSPTDSSGGSHAADVPTEHPTLLRRLALLKPEA
mmetsp:Transcript_20078/g.47021  ORF Transcript_20078/g.47021 Transcript_20078/m.47021 type:complete len:102 (+) Transcript_20078:103-408(+)